VRPSSPDKSSQLVGMHVHVGTIAGTCGRNKFEARKEKRSIRERWVYTWRKKKADRQISSKGLRERALQEKGRKMGVKGEMRANEARY